LNWEKQNLNFIYFSLNQMTNKKVGKQFSFWEEPP